MWGEFRLWHKLSLLGPSLHDRPQLGPDSSNKSPNTCRYRGDRMRLEQGSGLFHDLSPHIIPNNDSLSGPAVEPQTSSSSSSSRMGRYLKMNFIKEKKNPFFFPCVCFSERPSGSQRRRGPTGDRRRAGSGRHWCESVCVCCFRPTDCKRWRNFEPI